MTKRKEEALLAFEAARLFDNTITSAFWSSFKGEYGFTQISVLVYLFDHGTGRAAEIAEELNVPKQHISKIVADFVKRGLVVYRKDDRDRRANVLSLSEAGKDYLLAHIKVSDDHFYEVMDQMDEDERREFLLALKAIVKVLNRQ